MGFMGTPDPSAGTMADRHICCTMTSVLVRMVREARGEAGVDELLARAGSNRDSRFLESTENWVSLPEAVSLLEAGIGVVGDPMLPRRVGAQAVRQHAGTQVATLLRSLGSPEAVLRSITTTAAKFSTVTEMEAKETGPSHAIVTARARPGFRRAKPLCEWTQGLLSTPCELFGLPPAQVKEVECQADGGSECRYEVSWDGGLAEVAADPQQRVTALEAQVLALSDRLESAYATASDLVSADDLDSVLGRIVERAADAVRAPAYVLTVKLEEDGEDLVFSDGIPAEQASALAASATDEAQQTSNVLCVEVASSRRTYGCLLAVYPGGESFFAQERQLLGLYAKHAAAVLDTTLALRESARRNTHVNALLSLSQAMAAAETTADIARQLTESVVDLVDCDRSSVWLWDGATECLRHEWSTGDPSLVSRRAISPTEMVDLPRMLSDPQPMFFPSENPDPLLDAIMTDAHLVALAVVPVIAHGVLLALLTAGVETDPGRIRCSPELIEKLTGVAALAASAIQNRKLIDELARQVIRDGLTGVLNRTGFLRSIEGVLRDGRTDGPAGLLFVDIDGFKQLNDRYGHNAGDELLRQAAERLRETVRGEDLVARVGGDEFAIVLPRARTREEVEAAAQRVDEAFGSPFQLDRQQVTVRASVGEAFSSQRGSTLDDLVRMADSVMYARKAEHRALAVGVVAAPS